VKLLELHDCLWQPGDCIINANIFPGALSLRVTAALIAIVCFNVVAFRMVVSLVAIAPGKRALNYVEKTASLLFSFFALCCPASNKNPTDCHLHFKIAFQLIGNV